MSDLIKVLMLEDDEAVCEAYRREIEKKQEMELVYATGCEGAALNYLRTNPVDVVILDLELHYGGGNGLFFLDGLKKMNLSHRPYILVTTNNSSVITLEQARSMGADFIMAKYESQYSAQYVVEFLRMMSDVILEAKAQTQNSAPVVSEEERTRSLTQRIHRELDFVGISPKAIGYQYLTDAILLTFHDPQPNLCRKLSEKYHKTDVSIERAMQNAINRAWRTSDPDDLLEHYTARIRSDKGVPTLMEFVSHYVNVLRLEY